MIFSIILNVILFILLFAAVFFIYYLKKILKKAFDIINFSSNEFKGEPAAYNGKYYPAAIINQIIFDSKEDKVVVDFSIYKEKKIVGFTVYRRESQEEYCKNNNLVEGIVDKPVLIKNVVVYEMGEGLWVWKRAQ